MLKKNNKFGLISPKAKELISFEYDTLLYKNNTIIAKKDGKYGVLDYFSTEIIKLEHDSLINQYYDKYVFTKSNNILIYNKKGELLKEVSKNNFSLIGSNGYVLVKNDDKKMGVLDYQLEQFIPTEFDEIQILSKDYGNNSFYVKSKTKTGIYNSQKIFYPLKKSYDKLTPLLNYYIVSSGGKYGLLNSKTFEEVVPCEYDIIANYNKDYSSELKKVVVIKGNESKIIDVR